MSSLSDVCKKNYTLNGLLALPADILLFVIAFSYFSIQGEVPVDLTEKQRIFYKNYEPMEGGIIIIIIIVIITILIILARCQHCLCSWRLLCLRLPSRPLQVEAQANVEGAPCMKLNSNQAITFLK